MGALLGNQTKKHELGCPDCGMNDGLGIDPVSIGKAITTGVPIIKNLFGSSDAAKRDKYKQQLLDMGVARSQWGSFDKDQFKAGWDFNKILAQGGQYGVQYIKDKLRGQDITMNMTKQLVRDFPAWLKQRTGSTSVPSTVTPPIPSTGTVIVQPSSPTPPTSSQSAGFGGIPTPVLIGGGVVLAGGIAWYILND